MSGRVQSALDAVSHGAGSVLLLAGRSGSGMSHGLARAGEQVARSGMTVARARGREAERPLAFGVATDLVEQFGGATGPPLRGAAGAGDGGLGVIRAVWALARSVPGGVALVVDDLHDVDAPTLRLLAYGAARLPDWPVLLLAAYRINAESAEPAAMRAITHSGTSLSTAPPSAAAVAGIVRAQLPEAPAELCLACDRATAGNPALLVALVTDLARLRAPSAELDPGGIQRTVGPAVSALLAERMARLPDPARRLAHVLAGRDGPVAAAKATVDSGLGTEAMALAVDALVADGLLADRVPLTLAPPIIRAAIRAGLTLGQQLGPSAAARPGSPAGAAAYAGDPASPETVETLTPSEGRVAHLAARGMTTKQIAAALFVTSKTVEFHLRNVYRKLEIPSSRADLARALADMPRLPSAAGDGSPAVPMP